jgi:ferredoxin
MLLILPAGWRVAVQPGQSLLEAADAAGIRLPRSCRNGTCRRCLCRLASGTILYRIEWPGVSADERAEGWILPCVSEADSREITIEAPDASGHTAPAPHPERCG